MFDFQQVFKAERKAKKPYGDVKYADPGYQSDGKARYPVDTKAHAEAAWTYIQDPKNAGEYTDKQLKLVKDRIIAAYKKLVNSEGPPEMRKKK